MSAWPLVLIKDVARIVGGSTPKSGTAEFWDGQIPWATPKDLSDLDGKFIEDTPRKISQSGLNSCSSELLPPNSVLFSSRAPIGHVAINTVPMATNQGFKSFVPKPKIDASYLYWWLKCHRSDLERLGNGATFKEVSKAVVERIEIPLPPLEEQKRIAAILDQADDIRRKRQHAIDRLNQLGQAVFHEMFGREDGPNIPLSGYFEEIRMGPFGSMLHKSDYVDGGIPLINPMHIADGEIAPNPKFSIEQRKAKELTSYRLREGDVVVGRRGEMGRCAVVLAAHEGYLCGTGSMFLRAASDKADPFFIAELIRSKNVIKKIESVAAGVTMMNLNSTSFDRVMVPKISIKDQQAYFKRVRFISDSMQMMMNHHSTMNRIFTSLQHRAFTGQL